MQGVVADLCVLRRCVVISDDYSGLVVLSDLGDVDVNAVIIVIYADIKSNTRYTTRAAMITSPAIIIIFFVVDMPILELS